MLSMADAGKEEEEEEEDSCLLKSAVAGMAALMHVIPATTVTRGRLLRVRVHVVFRMAMRDGVAMR